MRIRIAFIGAGSYAREHAMRIAAMNDAEVVAACSRRIDRARELTSEFGGDPYDNIENMLDKIRPDAAFICLTPAAHGPAEHALIARGVPFLVEKPVAATMEAAEAIGRAVCEKKLITAVGYQWRYSDLVAKALEVLGGARILMAQGYWLSTRPKHAWWHDPAQSGGQILEQATHMLDLLRLFLGEPDDIHAVMSPSAEGSEVPAATAVTMRFNHIPATMICACALPVRYRCGLVIHSEKAVIELMSKGSGMMNVELAVKTSKGVTLHLPEVDSVARMDAAFLEAIRTGDRSLVLSDYAEGIKTMAISLRCVDSAKRQQLVKMEG